MPKIHLVLLIHGHQPVGNFDHVFETLYQRSYLPFFERLERHPGVRMGLHYTGPLLEWLEIHHPEFLERVRAMTDRGQVELVGGGFYEPILVSLPHQDAVEQIRRMASYLERRFAQPPSGLWLAERVWEPHLPTVLAAGGVGYTLLDDQHFLSAGMEPEHLFGYYVVEDRGACVKVIPGLKPMRYMLPFQAVEDVIGFLRGAAERHPDGMVAMGDDNEKFGGWPSTYDHCYRDGWLDRFFDALEKNADWLITTPPGEYLSSHAPLGRVDLPAASYSELMEWVLPTGSRRDLHGLNHEFEARLDVLRFLRGGIWRGFFSKYSESNLLHKKALYVSRKLQSARVRKEGDPDRAKMDEARTHLLRSQCNDAYWHGIFGGLYSPHLRTALWNELVRAETLLDSAQGKNVQGVRAERIDFDADGIEETYLTAQPGALLVKANDGATVPLIDFRPSGITLVNSLTRRLEAYHSRLANATQSDAAGVTSIHEQTKVKEPGLEGRLRYDRWARNCFRVLVFPHGKTREDYEWIRLGESAAIAGGFYSSSKPSRNRFEFVHDAPIDLDGASPQGSSIRVQKTFRFEPSEDSFVIRCAIEVSHNAETFPQCDIGIESVFNLLAPDAHDRFFEFGGERHPLNWSGAATGSIRIVDEWQNVAIGIDAPVADEFWIEPVETVSESEEGFERVYQGSQILAIWRPTITAGKTWNAELTLQAAKAR